MKTILALILGVLVLGVVAQPALATTNVEAKSSDGWAIYALTSSAGIDSAASDTFFVELKEPLILTYDNDGAASLSAVPITLGNGQAAAADSVNLALSVSADREAWIAVYAMGNDNAALNGQEGKKALLTSYGRFLRVIVKNVSAAAGGGNTGTSSTITITHPMRH